MAVIIDENMPKGCCWKQESGCFDICKLRKVCGRGVSDKPLMTGYRHRDCPIIGEIPDKHGDLKDANAILRWLNSKADNRVPVTIGEIIDFIEKQPTVLEASEGTGPITGFVGDGTEASK